MGLKRRNRVSPNFSMASMTDVIFLLLIFFMITSTVVSPNAIKVLLPQGKQQTSAKPLTRVVIDKDLNFYAAFGNEKEQPVALNDLTSFLQSCAEKEPEMYVALYADESVPYREIVRVLNIANENHFKMVLATRPPENKSETMDRRKKGEYIGALGALLVHVAVIALLILVSFTVPQPDEDAGGVPVMMGNVDAASGFDDPSLVDVDIMDEDAAAPAEAEPQLPSEQDLLTQTEEETVTLKAKKPEKTEAEKAAEAKRLAEEKAERERKAAEEAAKKRVSGAFGKGAQMTGNKGTATSGTGTEGSKEGNSSTGAKTGTGGYGTFDLGGRSLGTGSLPKPAYNVQEEGRVVVNITVNPAGQVVSTSISPQTNTVNSALRKAAEDAAKKARFNTIDGVNNQTGTITYYFNLR